MSTSSVMYKVEDGFILYFHAFVYEITLNISSFLYGINEEIGAFSRKKLPTTEGTNTGTRFVAGWSDQRK